MFISSEGYFDSAIAIGAHRYWLVWKSCTQNCREFSSTMYWRKGRGPAEWQEVILQRLKLSQNNS